MSDADPTRDLVAISILNWNRWRGTERCLESIRRLAYRDFLIVVVDNGSLDGSAAELAAWLSDRLGGQGVVADYNRQQALAGGLPEVEQRLGSVPATQRGVLIRNQENLGFPGGHNVAIRYALTRPQPARYVFLLNNDATVHPACLTRLVETAGRTSAGVVGAVQVDPQDGRVTLWGAGGSMPLLRQFFQPLVPRCTEVPEHHSGYWPALWVAGAAMLVSGEALGSVAARTGRYLDDKLFLYWEELEFCSTARTLGYESVVCASAVCYHKPEGFSSGGRFNPVAYYYSNRNRILLALRLLPLGLRVPFLALDLAATAGRVIKMVCARRYDSAAAALAGWRDGLGRRTGKWKNHDRALVGREILADSRGRRTIV